MTDWRTQRDRALFVLEHDPNPLVRAEAAESICELAATAAARAPELHPAVVRLVADKQAEVRCSGLALAAMTLPPEEAEELLVRHLADGAIRVRVEAAGRLADLVRPSARGA